MNVRWKWISACLIVLMGCNEKESDNKAGFETSSEVVREDDGTAEIKILLDRPAGQATSIYFEFEGEAAMHGDFKLITTSPLEVEADSREAFIEIELIDESTIESSEDINITLTASDGTLVISQTSSEFTLTIEDNDEPPDEGIQVDLTWASEGEMDIDEFDLNLLIANNVEIVDDYVEGFDIYSKSENETGFETAWIDADAQDGEYYIVAIYKNGNNDIPYTLELNGSGFNHETVNGDFTEDDVGTAVFYGPVTKDGNSFSKVMPSGEKIILKLYKSESN